MDHLQSHLLIDFAQFSDKGPKAENQDTIGARIPDGPVLTAKGIAIVVADGVSSSPSAKQASQVAVTGFLNDYYATPDTWSTQHSAEQVIQSLNRYLWGQSRNSVREEGHLCTFTCLILKGSTAFVFHIGDTRLYRLRAGQLEQLTRDHSQKIDRNTHYLSRALGADLCVDIDCINEDLKNDDIFLLSSDGVHESLSQSGIHTLLNQDLSAEHIIDQFKAQLADCEVCDNISAQIVKVIACGSTSQSDAFAHLSHLPFPPILNVGNTIDAYTVSAILHESERSQIYLVKDSEGNKLVMKTPSLNYVDDLAYIERFVMEAWIGSRIQNAQVARVVEPRNARNYLYYLTEYLPGPTLAKLIKERAPMDISDSVELMEGLVKGLRSFHRKDTLHQDIKPDNIIIAKRGPVIIDFGSCFVAGVQELAVGYARDKILGTLNYSAPEYRYAGKISQRSDQFSLAVILYEMLTGAHPYGAGYEAAMSLQAFQRLAYIPARRLNHLIPIWLDRALEKAVSINPAARYPALSEWLKDLQRPNPAWLRHDEGPLLERDPLLFWRALAAFGWIAFFIVLLVKFGHW